MGNPRWRVASVDAFLERYRELVDAVFNASALGIDYQRIGERCGVHGDVWQMPEHPVVSLADELQTYERILRRARLEHPHTFEAWFLVRVMKMSVAAAARTGRVSFPRSTLQHLVSRGLIQDGDRALEVAISEAALWDHQARMYGRVVETVIPEQEQWASRRNWVVWDDDVSRYV